MVPIPIFRSLVYSVASDLTQPCVFQDILIFVIICRHMVTSSHTSCGVQFRLSTVPRLLRFTLIFLTLFGSALVKRIPVSLGHQLPAHVYPSGRQRPCVAAHDMEQPSERIDPEPVSRRHSAATSLCMRRAVSTPVNDRGIPSNTMRRWRPRRVDALTATAQTQVLHNETRTTTDPSKNLSEPGSPRR